MIRASLYKPGYKHPMWERTGTSDAMAALQVFDSKDYDFAEVENPKVIVDAGANVGYASIFFAHKYPKAKIFAIEPDSGNFDLLVKNCRPYNVFPQKNALWCDERSLEIDRNPWDNGARHGFWAIRTIQWGGNPLAEMCYSITPTALMNTFKIEKIDLLKIDIEGAEKYLFSKKLDWLDQVENIVIELHGKECECAFFLALTPYRYQAIQNRELTFIKNLKRRRHAHR